MSSVRPCLTFKMRLPYQAEKNLIFGRLYLQLENQIQQEFKCTSGLAGKQFRAAQMLKSVGPLPDSKIISPLQYKVRTNAHTMDCPGHKGVPMYSIIPNSIRLGMDIRGEFGIHQDLNVPGTIGCIALSEESQWSLFKNAMKKIAGTGIDFVPLIVIYY